MASKLLLLVPLMMAMIMLLVCTFVDGATPNQPSIQTDVKAEATVRRCKLGQLIKSWFASFSSSKRGGKSKSSTNKGTKNGTTTKVEQACHGVYFEVRDTGFNALYNQILYANLVQWADENEAKELKTKEDANGQLDLKKIHEKALACAQVKKVARSVVCVDVSKCQFDFTDPANRPLLSMYAIYGHYNQQAKKNELVTDVFMDLWRQQDDVEAQFLSSDPRYNFVAKFKEERGIQKTSETIEEEGSTSEAK